MNNKKLKFRIWDKADQIFVKNSSSLHAFSNWMINPFTGKAVDFVAGIDGDHEPLYTRHDDPEYWIKGAKIIKDSAYSIQQFTGLLDKNEKEIYEGDIVKYNRLFESERKIKELKSAIEFQNGSFGFRLAGFNEMFFNLGDEFKIEVIGNIFENPELLNKQS